MNLVYEGRQWSCNSPRLSMGEFGGRLSRRTTSLAKELSSDSPVKLCASSQVDELQLITLGEGGERNANTFSITDNGTKG